MFKNCCFVIIHYGKCSITVDLLFYSTPDKIIRIQNGEYHLLIMFFLYDLFNEGQMPKYYITKHGILIYQISVKVIDKLLY